MRCWRRWVHRGDAGRRGDGAAAVDAGADQVGGDHDGNNFRWDFRNLVRFIAEGIAPDHNSRVLVVIAGRLHRESPFRNVGLPGTCARAPGGAFFTVV